MYQHPKNNYNLDSSQDVGLDNKLLLDLIQLFCDFSIEIKKLVEQCRQRIAEVFLTIKKEIISALNKDSYNLKQLLEIDLLKYEVLQKESLLYKECFHLEKRIHDDQQYMLRKRTQIRLTSSMRSLHAALEIKRAILSRLSSRFLFYRQKQAILNDDSSENFSPSGISLTQLTCYYRDKLSSISHLTSAFIQQQASPLEKNKGEVTMCMQNTILQLQKSFRESMRQDFDNFREVYLKEFLEKGKEINSSFSENLLILRQLRNEFGYMATGIHENQKLIMADLEKFKNKLLKGNYPRGEWHISEEVKSLEADLREDIEKATEIIHKGIEKAKNLLEASFDVHKRNDLDDFCKEIQQLLQETFSKFEVYFEKEKSQNDENRRLLHASGTELLQISDKLRSLLQYINKELGLCLDHSDVAITSTSSEQDVCHWESADAKQGSHRAKKRKRKIVHQQE